MKILIADDDAVAARILEATLLRLDWEVTAVRDGAAVWETDLGAVSFLPKPVVPETMIEELERMLAGQPI